MPASPPASVGARREPAIYERDRVTEEVYEMLGRPALSAAERAELKAKQDRLGVLVERANAEQLEALAGFLAGASAQAGAGARDSGDDE